MRRRIIKQGNKSYTLTLPINWIREEKLDQGGEVEIEQEDNHLIVFIPKDIKKTESVITFSSKNYNERTLRNILNYTYRKGYDKIIFEKPNKKQVEDIRDITRNTLLGFEVISENNDSCVIQNIAEPSGDNFFPILRKLFFYVLDESKEILDEFKKGKANELKKIERNKNVIDNYTNLCRRLIIKERIGGSKNSYGLFNFITRLGLVYHSYYYMYKFAAHQKGVLLSKSSLDLLEKANNALSLLSEAFYEKNMDKAHEIGVLKDKLLYVEFYNLLQKSKGKESVVLYHIGEIIRLIHLCSVNIFGLYDLEFK